MNSLIYDIWSYIMRFIKNNSDKYRLLVSCKEMSKCDFYFYETIPIHKIQNIRWFNRFTNIIVLKITNKLPISVKKISFALCNQITPKYLPNTITTIKFSYIFDQPIKGCIPSSVKKIIFGEYFNQPIDGCIPSSVKKIVFGRDFNQPIKGHIPLSVTHLALGNFFCHITTDYIPSSVTHLSFYNFSLTGLASVPSSVTHLEFLCNGYDNKPWRGRIPTHLKSLIIAEKQYI